jgi:hypothetical protein
VSVAPRGRVDGLALAWIACGGTILALAFTLRPVRASSAVFWTIAGTGGLAIVAGCALATRGVASWRGRSGRAASRRRQTLAAECHRLHEALAAFLAERDRERPKSPLRISNSHRDDAWRAETALRYREELRTWALQVFDEVATCGAAAPGARHLVHSPATAQLCTVRDLFDDAAVQLERS